MNILIIEDEKRNAKLLERLLLEIDSRYIINGPLVSVEETVAYLNSNNQPNLILADIRLTDGLSFEAIRQSGTNAPIIFTTAYDEYAIKAFKFNSFDYLLKPIDIDELRAAIKKVTKTEIITQNNNIQQLIAQMQENNYNYRERFLIPWRDGYRCVMVNDINHIVLKNRIVTVQLNDNTSLNIPYTMDELEKQLNPKVFFRANRQYLININHILSISNYFNNRLIIRLKGYDNEEIIISRDRVAEIKVWLDR
jgi:Response regulator of the LytR/AlgR family